jgi:hypothetical protein
MRNEEIIKPKTTSEKPVSLPSDFQKTLKALLETKPEPKEKKPVEKKKPNSR